MITDIPRMLALGALSILTVSCGINYENPNLKAYRQAVAAYEAEQQLHHRLAKEQEQRQLEQQKRKVIEMAQARPKQQEPPPVKAQDPQKTEAVSQLKNTEQEISEKNNEPEDPAPQDAYGSNDAATPIAFLRLSPAEKAALHWAAAQERWLRLVGQSRAFLKWCLAGC